jgi:hypothetical protein
MGVVARHDGPSQLLEQHQTDRAGEHFLVHSHQFQRLGGADARRLGGQTGFSQDVADAILDDGVDQPEAAR